MEYRYGISDKIIAYLTLLSGLVISAVAVWYSVAGLVSIFAANAISIIIMGVALEVSKLVATVWLKWNWHRAPRLIKTYLISAISILMLITSMGIFGYLSKAHLDQNLVSGGVQAQLLLIDEKIKIERETIANAQTVIKQMDAAVTGVIATGDQEVKLRDGSTQVRSAAERSLQIRRSQAKDREALTKQIEQAQARIVKLQEEAAPIRAEMREVEAKVGPIKYIAALIYGDNPDANILEKAVTWVIIIIVLVFDPLAVILLLASQYSFQWFRAQREQEEAKDEQEAEDFFTRGKLVARGIDADEEARLAEEANIKLDEIKKEADIETTLASIEQIKETSEVPSVEGITSEQWNNVLSESEKELVDHDEDLFDEDDSDAVKEAKKLWKQDHPNDSLKRHKKLLEKGLITELPWEKYIKIEADFQEDEAAAEAAKWAQEQLDSKKKDNILDGNRAGQASEKDQRSVEGYVQNAEQSSETLWSKVKKSKEI